MPRSSTAVPSPRPAPARRPVARAGATALLAAALCALPASASAAASDAASAGVRLVPDSTAAGGSAQLTFRVANDSEEALTTSVSVQLPEDEPFLSLSVKPVPGWRAAVARTSLPEPVEVDGEEVSTAPVSVTWNAEPEGQMAPGEYQEFSLSVGPLPAEGTTVEVPVTQAYSDGTESEAVTPAFTTTAADSAAEGGGAGIGPWLGGAGLLAGAAALAVALVALRRGQVTART